MKGFVFVIFGLVGGFVFVGVSENIFCVALDLLGFWLFGGLDGEGVVDFLFFLSLPII